MPAQGIGGRRRQIGYRYIHALTIGTQEMLSQRQYITMPFPQGRQPRLRDVQAIQQIETETAGGNGMLEIDVGRRHQAYIHGNRFARTDAHHLALLQHPQQLNLHGQRQVADFIQKQRAAMGGLEPAFAPAHRTGKRTGLMTEQFAFREVIADGAAIDREKRTGAAAQLMNVPRHQFLAGAGLTADEHRRLAGRQYFNVAQQVTRCRIGKNQRLRSDRQGLGVAAFQRQQSRMFLRVCGHGIPQCKNTFSAIVNLQSMMAPCYGHQGSFRRNLKTERYAF